MASKSGREDHALLILRAHAILPQVPRRSGHIDNVPYLSHLWIPLCLQADFELFGCDRVRSSVRPFDAAFRMPLAGMGDTRFGTMTHFRVRHPVRKTGCSEPDLADHLPLLFKASLTSRLTDQSRAQAARAGSR